MTATENDDLRETAELLDRIATGKSAWEELPDNDALEETADILERVAKGKEAWDVYLGLPREKELSAIIAKLERIAELKSELKW